MCASCNSNYEDLNHIFFECSFAIQVWKSAGMWFDVQHAAMQTDSAVEAIFYLLRNLSVKLNQRFAALCWSLWKHRNLKIWEDVTELSAVVVDRARVRCYSSAAHVTASCWPAAAFCHGSADHVAAIECPYKHCCSAVETAKSREV